MDMPWDDLKVAFGFDGDEEGLWAAFGPGGTGTLPAGWSLNETDSSGARKVAVFRIEGPLVLDDARAVSGAIKAVV